MRAFYIEHGLLGCSNSHIWSLTHCNDKDRGRWWVSGLTAFTSSGPAVVDDFGTLVEVPR